MKRKPQTINRLVVRLDTLLCRAASQNEQSLVVKMIYFTFLYRFKIYNIIGSVSFLHQRLVIQTFLSSAFYILHSLYWCENTNFGFAFRKCE